MESDVLFGRLLVEQGMARPEHVEECLSHLRRLAAEGVSPLPTLASLLTSRGYLAVDRLDPTLRATPAPSGTASTASSGALPAEVERAQADRENTVGKYVRVTRLGAGGMGEVWRAWDRELGRWVALKFLKGNDPAELARFQREAQTAARLSHPNIAAVYEVGEDAGRSYIAMQLIEGRTLGAFSRDDRRLLVALLRDAALAVHHAHEQGVVHRDLKPHNIMVEGQPKAGGKDRSAGLRVFVLDFGLAKQATVDSSLSASGSILGTPAYMPPEQARGRLGEIDARSDVYSLGATLYELLADAPPFQASDVYDLLRRVVEEEPRPLRAVNPKLDEDAETIVAKCLDKDRERRYPSAQALAEDLQRFLDGEPISARPASVAYRVKKRLVKNAALSIAIGAAVAIALAAAGAFVAGAVRKARELERIEAHAAELLKTAEERRSRKDWSGAVEALGQYLPIKPGDEHARKLKEECDRGVEEQKKQAALREVVQAASDLCRAAMGHAKDAKALLRIRASRRDQWAPLFEEALRMADSAIEKYPDLAGSHSTRGEILEAQGRWRDAVASFDRALELDAALAEAWRGRGLCFLELYAEEVMVSLVSRGAVWVVAESTDARRSREEPLRKAAFASLEKFAKLKGVEPAATVEFRSMQAAVAIAEHRYAEAEQSCDKLLAEVKTDDRVWILKAAAQHAQGRYAEALQTMDEMIGDVLPHDSRAHLMRAWTKVKLGNWAGALEDSNRAVALDPASSKAYLVRAQGRGHRLDVAGALQDIDKAIELDPKSPYGYAIRARAKAMLGDWPSVVADCTRAIEINPEHPTAYVNRGLGKTRLGDKAGALEDFRRAAELDPKDDMAFDQFIRAKLDLGDRDGLFKYLDDLIQRHPRDADFYYRRARLRSDFGENAPSLPDYDKAIELDGGQSEYYRCRGSVRSNVGDWAGAESDLSKSVELNPGHAWAQAGLGHAKAHRGDLDAALRHCDEALRLDPKDSTLYPVRGRVRLARKEYAEALEDFKKAVSLWAALESEVGPLMEECRKHLPRQ